MGQRLHRTKKGFHGFYNGDLSNNDANHTAEDMLVSEQYDQQQPPLLSQQDTSAIWSEWELDWYLSIIISLTRVKMLIKSGIVIPAF